MPEIIVYSTPTCPWCKKVKEYLRRRRYSFKDFDVTDDVRAQDAMMRKSGQMGVPVLEIAGKVIVGFDEGEIERALKMITAQKKATPAVTMVLPVKKIVKRIVVQRGVKPIKRDVVVRKKATPKRVLKLNQRKKITKTRKK